MPEYLAPGVYVEEIEIGPKPIEGVSTSTAGFLGLTERGPITPMLITSFEDYQRIFGGFLDTSYLTYAVEGFFRNEGKRCYIGRIISNDATASEATITVGSNNIVLRAIGPGTWGNGISFSIQDATQPDGPPNTRFKLVVKYSSLSIPQINIIETYDDISVNPKSSSFYKSSINGVSNLVTAFDDIKPNDTPTVPSNTTTDANLQNGGDGTAITADVFKGYKKDLTDPANNNAIVGSESTGLEAFEAIDDISIACIPDEEIYNSGASRTLSNLLVDHCEKLKYRFAIVQAHKADIGNIGSLVPFRDSKYAAFYFPMINVYDPINKNLKLIPPGGHIAGIYARTDSTRGVEKAPANELVRGAISLQLNASKGTQEILNPKGINVTRVFQGRGPILWGARTISKDPLWKYVNVRRLFNFIERSIDEGTQWLVFEPNNERLWSRVIATIKQFLTQVWRDGALMGTTPEEAFFVKCDRTTMTQNDIDTGKLIVLIGICPVKPAEFVIFRIAQTKSGSEVLEV
jgi:phage tail sheath protein FI